MSQNTDIEKVSQKIESAIAECGIRSISTLPKFMQAIRMGQGIVALRQALTDTFVQATLMPLQGTALGFLTDKDKEGGYGLNVVRDCAIEAMLRGFGVVGNEFNIIAGRFYGTKGGFERQVCEFPGLRDLVLQPGVPQLIGDKGALVPFSASWTLQGKAMRIDCQQTKEVDQRIPVKVNSGMGSDAIIGKATRKVLYRIYQRVNGSSYGLVDGEVGDEPIVTTGETAPSPVPPGTPEGKRIKLGGKKAEAKAEAKEPEPKAEPAPKAAEPKPANDVPISGPPPVDLDALHEVLAVADEAWSFPGAVDVFKTWSEPQRRGALDWANAVVHDGPMAIQVNRPAHTLYSRQPGED